MAYRLMLSYNTSRSKRDPHAYNTRITEIDDPLHPLRQHGEVFNNIVTYVGVFATNHEASQAARDYIRGS
jgi:hypothetical protein